MQIVPQTTVKNRQHCFQRKISRSTRRENEAKEPKGMRLT